ncbi:MAG: LuxR family transcriptional regulator [Aquabacterium sp.]
MLQGGYASVLGARTRQEFLDEIVRFTQQLGFETVSALAVVDQGLGQSDFVSVHNAPDGWEDAYYSVAGMRADPVMQHCRLQTVPLIWDQATYTTRGMGELWEEQASYGFHTGIAMALHMPDGRHFALGVERDQPLPTDRGELTRLVAHLQLFAVHAQESAMRVLVVGANGGVDDGEAPVLTARELEALRWTMEGKTGLEVAIIMGVSARTVSWHLSNACAKLGTNSKHQAVVRALKLGLIH